MRQLASLLRKRRLWRKSLLWQETIGGEIWTAEAIEKWIEDFKDEPYDEFNGTWIEKDEIDMDMSLEEC